MKTRNIIFGALLSVLVSFALCQQLQAAGDTPDPGSVANTNTADGLNALANNGAGFGNSGFGWFASWANTGGNFNTAVGVAALDLNGFNNNTAVGAGAMLLSQGNDNTAVGTAALENNNANGNTATGSFALFANMISVGNTAVGFQALLFNDRSGMGEAGLNTAVGFNALSSNINAFTNTAVGFQALMDNDSSANGNADHNTAVGSQALQANVNASDNTAVGRLALFNNDFSQAGSATDNTAVGSSALANNGDGHQNTAVGSGALAANTGTPDDGNVAVGYLALTSFNGTTAADGVHTALGSHALEFELTGEFNVAVGRRALNNVLSGSGNVAMGHDTGFTYVGGESGNVTIGTDVLGVIGDVDTIRIADSTSPTFPAAKCFIGGIFGVPGAGAHGVTVNAAGQLADATVSSRRFKKDIAPIDKISEGILALKPVTFHFKSDATNYPQFGLIAEDVAEVNPDLITRDPKGEIYGVRYDTIPILLLNEFLKEHKKVEEQQASIAELKSTVAQQAKGMEVLTAQLKEQAAQIQKVSAQIEMNKPAAKVVVNKP